MREFSPSKFVLVTVVLCVSCATAGSQIDAASTQNVSGREANAVLGLDFSSLVGVSEFVTFSTEGLAASGTERTVLRTCENSARNLGVVDDLSSAELGRLGIWVLPDGQRISILDLHSKIVNHYAVHCKLPSSGVDLFPELAALSARQIGMMDKDELFLKYAVGINPITGRFYSSFSPENRTPGGYAVEIVDDPMEVEARYSHKRLFKDPLDPDAGYVLPVSVWQITVFGENPDEVIFETESCFL
jgi:hypothetical protein